MSTQIAKEFIQAWKDFSPNFRPLVITLPEDENITLVEWQDNDLRFYVEVNTNRTPPAIDLIFSNNGIVVGPETFEITRGIPNELIARILEFYQQNPRPGHSMRSTTSS